ncbi:uncharacterized protein LOC132047561 [Lycium ferocissimum]|uniref:uncharacterized protein LOC132047561 n=1 Tax=Lycium ferocissimum TaxID=112874 RepID=UPI002814A208|nr:uncharacterized protein LOC132047561 [Lycium ferocissimum]
MELLKDYGIIVLIILVRQMWWRLQAEIQQHRVLACVEARSSLEQIKASQFENASLNKNRDKVLRGEAKEAVFDDEVFLRIKGGIYVPHVDDLIKIILTKAHSYRYSIHPGATKMYRDLKRSY